MRPLLLVIRTGERELREYLLLSIAQQYRIHMLLVADPTWELDYLDGHTRVDTRDVQAMITVAKDLQVAEHISGVLCWDEAGIAHAAEVAQALGLPGDPAATALCRDRHLTRQALAAAGVPQPHSVRVATLPDALVEAGRMGYPLMVGEQKADTAEQLTVAFDYRSQATVLEEFIDGDRITVDIGVHSGEIFPLCLARKQSGGCWFVHAEDPLLHDPVLIRVLHDTHRALGFYDGVTHTEIVMSMDGPKVVSVNGHLGGHLIPYLGLRATGVDTALAAAAVACGRAPLVERDRKLVAAVRFFPADGAVRFEGAGGLPEAVDRLVVLADKTAQGYAAFATAVAATAQECAQALDAAGTALHIAR